MAKKSARKAATAGGAPKSAAKKPATKKSGLAAGGGTPGKAGGASPRLLSGGNPQIPKGYGDGPVQAYIDAMPDWKQAVGRLLDDLVVKTVPGVRKAVKWNTPLYGFETDDGSHAWFLAYHCMTRYVKVTFFRGAQLTPPPPEPSKIPDVRYFHIHEGDAVDTVQLEDWIHQANPLPGERM